MNIFGIIRHCAFIGVDRSIPVRVPEASIADYQAAEHWNRFANFQPMTEEDIAAWIGNVNKEPQEAIVYDLQGRRMTDAGNLKGFYIVNGKKYLVK